MLSCNLFIVRLWCLELPIRGSIAYLLRQVTFLLSLSVYLLFQPKEQVLYGREPEVLGFVLSGKRKVIELHHLHGLRLFGRFLLARMEGSSR